MSNEISKFCLYKYLYIYSKKREKARELKSYLSSEISKNCFGSICSNILFNSREVFATVQKHLAVNMRDDKRINSCLLLLGIHVKCSI